MGAAERAARVAEDRVEAVGCEPARPVADRRAAVVPDFAADRAVERAVEVAVLAVDFAVDFPVDFTVDLSAERACDAGCDVVAVLRRPDGAVLAAESLAGAEATDEPVAGGHGGLVSLCSRCTMSTASDLLLAVMPDSTCERQAGLRSDSFRSVLR